MKKYNSFALDLADYLDGVADQSLRAEIEKHIGECPNCRVMIDTLRMTVRICRESGECEDLPPELAERIHAKLRERWNEKFQKE